MTPTELKLTRHSPTLLMVAYGIGALIGWLPVAYAHRFNKETWYGVIAIAGLAALFGIAIWIGWRRDASASRVSLAPVNFNDADGAAAESLLARVGMKAEDILMTGDRRFRCSTAQPDFDHPIVG